MIAESAVLMPFGAHKNQPLNVLARPYLEWVLRQEWVDLWLKAAIRDELARRDGSTLPAEVGEPLAVAIIDAGHRALLAQAEGDPVLLLAIDATAVLLEAWATTEIHTPNSERTST